jgi:hypothetical protein
MEKDWNAGEVILIHTPLLSMYALAYSGWLLYPEMDSMPEWLEDLRARAVAEVRSHKDAVEVVDLD